MFNFILFHYQNNLENKREKQPEDSGGENLKSKLVPERVWQYTWSSENHARPKAGESVFVIW